MKYKLLILLMFVGFVSSAQLPGYTTINSRYDWLAGHFKALHIPAFGTTPSLKTGQYTGSGAVGIDSVLHRMFFYSGATWRRILSTLDTATMLATQYDLSLVSGENLATAALEADNDYQHNWKGFDLSIDSIGDLFLSSGTSGKYSYLGGGDLKLGLTGYTQFDDNNFASFGAFNSNGASYSYIDANAGSNYNYIRTESDSSKTPRRISYTHNIHGTFTPYSLIDKAFLDSIVSGISGGSPAGSDTYVQYNDGGAFGAEAAFAYNKTTNTLAVDKAAIGTTSTSVILEVAQPSGGNAVKITGVSGNSRFEFDASTAAALWTIANSASQAASLYLSPGSGFANDAPFWILERAAGNPSPFRIRAQKTAGVFDNRFQILPEGELVINEDGKAYSTRMETDGEANAFLLDGTNNRLGIMNGSPTYTLDVTGIIRTSAHLLLNDVSAPSTPASGTGALFVESDIIKFKDDGGNVYGLTDNISNANLTMNASHSLATGANTLTISTATSAVNPFAVTATTGNGISSTVTSGKAIYGENSGANVVFDAVKVTASTNAVQSIMNLRATSSGTAAAGFGSGLDFYGEADDNSNPIAASIKAKNTDAAAATYTTAIDWFLQNNNTNAVRMTLHGSGRLELTGRLMQKQGADVASVAGAIAVGVDGNTFEITGTNAITLISNLNFQNGSVIRLIFTSTATLTDGTANSGTDIGMELAGSTNFTASADDVVVLLLSEIGGTQRWREVSRSVN